MKTPLRKHILKHIKKNPVSFHTPGHKGRWDGVFSFDSGGVWDSLLTGGDSYSNFAKYLAKGDIPDDLPGFSQALEESMQEASRVYGSDASYYLVNGSSGGIMAAFLASFKPGSKVIAGRNLHKSAVSAMIMSGVSPVFVPIEYTVERIPLNISINALEEAVNGHPDAEGIYVTSPSHLGVSASLEEIISLAKSKNLLIITDEAWGAHFPFCDSLPPSTLSFKGDICIQSLHKTLPALTGTSILHCSGSKVSKEKVKSALRMIETTSPNMLFYLSAENAVSFMSDKGDDFLSTNMERINELIEDISIFMQENLLKGITMPLRDPVSAAGEAFLSDPFKLYLFTDPYCTGYKGSEIAKLLIENFSVFPEMADIYGILFVFTGFETLKDYEKLTEGLKRVLNKDLYFSSAPSSCSFIAYMLDSSSPGYFSAPVKTVLTPRDAFYSHKEMIPISSSKGRVCAGIATPYPPGIPALIPGEVVDKQAVDFITKIHMTGGEIQGLENINGQLMIEVVKE